MKQRWKVNCAALLCCALLFGGCVGAERTRTASSAPETGKNQPAKVSASSDAGSHAASADAVLTVKMPEGWTEVEGSSVLIQYQKVTHNFIVKTENFSADTLDGVVEEALGIYQQSFADVKVVGKPETLSVAGLDARSLTFTCVVSDMDMKFRYVYMFVRSKLYTLTFGDLANSFDRLADEYDSILKSVEIH